VIHRIALVTAREALALDPDMPPLIAAFEAVGCAVETPCWDDPAVDWAGFDAALLRSTWDYAPRAAEFQRFVARVAAVTQLHNPPALVTWSLDKHYLVDLAKAGVATVPTRFVEPGDAAAAALAAFLAGGAPRATPGATIGTAAEYVVKPAIGAGSKDAARYRTDSADDRARALDHLAALLAADRSVMLQPYLASVDAEGETAMVYLDGRLSHAIRKGPLLAPGAGFVEGLFAAEDIRPREPGKDEGRIAKAAFNAIPGPPPLYARVDLVRDAEGAPVVLELELVEPSLFFEHGPGAAERLVEGLMARIGVPTGL
jgi:O-ureido-D-serine cyclo-ligase